MSEIDRVRRMLTHAKSKHADLHSQVAQLERSVNPTAFVLVDKKKKKLNAKSEVTRLEALLLSLESSSTPQCELAGGMSPAAASG